MRLSKSKYLSGLQCHKKLYLETHVPALATARDETSEGRLEMGKEVGRLAHGVFPGGVLVEAGPDKLDEAVRQTSELARKPRASAIFQGAFTFGNVLVRVDILERVGRDRWRLIEVKSSTKAKDEHYPDLAIQTYVLTAAAIALSGSCVMHLNNQYIYSGGDLNLEQLFTIEDLTAEVTELLPQVPRQLASMRTVLTAPSPPVIEPDYHCEDPYPCPFWDHCTQGKPTRWIYHLSGGRTTFNKLVGLGIETIDEIPAGFPLSMQQQREKADVEWINPDLRAELTSVRYPIHHFDFETYMPAIPKYAMTRPYQTVPFQWSNHIETEDGKLRHNEYICADRRDPREELTIRLLESLGREGGICVYSGYEERILKELAEALPRFKPDIDRVIDRLWDLQKRIKKHYYHPQFIGSFSLKDVLPAVVPSLSYSDLEIKEGGAAAQQYYNMIFEATDPAGKDHIRRALLKYCERDTLALVKLRRVLLQKTNSR